MTATIATKNNLSDASVEEHTKLEAMLDALNKEEMEIAANASYDHLLEQNWEETESYAKQFALRFLRAKDGDESKALSRMKDTLQFRKEVDVDALRKAFNRGGNKEYAEKLEQDLQSKFLYVAGHDKEGRSTYVFVPRNVEGHDEEWTIKEHVYTLERAIASSQSADQTVNAVVDFNGFSLRNAPPTHIGKAFMNTFRNHYAGAINGIFFVDAPTCFYALWSVFKPLIGKKTRNKIHFVNSRKNDLSKFYNPSEAPQWMMRNGKKSRELDLEEYLHQTSFNQVFDV